MEENRLLEASHKEQSEKNLRRSEYASPEISEWTGYFKEEKLEVESSTTV